LHNESESTNGQEGEIKREQKASKKTKSKVKEGVCFNVLPAAVGFHFRRIVLTDFGFVLLLLVLLLLLPVLARKGNDYSLDPLTFAVYLGRTKERESARDKRMSEGGRTGNLAKKSVRFD
jgi:hypothetical protein